MRRGGLSIDQKSKTRESESAVIPYLCFMKQPYGVSRRKRNCHPEESLPYQPPKEAPGGGRGRVGRGGAQRVDVVVHGRAAYMA